MQVFFEKNIWAKKRLKYLKLRWKLEENEAGSPQKPWNFNEKMPDEKCSRFVFKVTKMSLKLQEKCRKK